MGLKGRFAVLNCPLGFETEWFLPWEPDSLKHNHQRSCDSLDGSQSSTSLRFGVALRAGQQWRVNQCFTTADRAARLHLMDELVGRSPPRKMGTEQWEHWGPLWASGRKKGVVVCVWGEFDREEHTGKTLKGHSEGRSVLHLKKDGNNNLIIQLKHNTCPWKEAGGNTSSSKNLLTNNFKTH